MIIFHVIYREDFEAEAFFDSHGSFLAGWHSSDANWRSEYMSPLLTALGITVERSNDSVLIQRVKEHFEG